MVNAWVLNSFTTPFCKYAGVQEANTKNQSLESTVGNVDY